MYICSICIKVGVVGRNAVAVGIFLLFIAVFVSCNHSPRPVSLPGSVGIIDVEAGMENLHPVLKLSDLGEKVDYIPLETCDSGLVSNCSNILLTDSVIVVNAGAIYSFARETGRFVAQVGHKGVDSTGYTKPTPFYNEQNGLFYFVRTPNQLQKYDVHGRYCGKAIVPTEPDLPASFLFVDSLVLGYHAVRWGEDVSNPRVLSVFSEDGFLKDSVVRISTWPLPGAGKTLAFMVCDFCGFKLDWCLYQDGRMNVSLTDPSLLWKCGRQVRVKDGFSDTVFTWHLNESLHPSFVFRYGQYLLDKESWSLGVSPDKLLATNVLETENIIYFRCLYQPLETLREVYKALFSANTSVDKVFLENTYHGVYDKRNGNIRMAPLRGLVDDFAGDLPCKIVGNGSKEFVGVIEAHEVVDWLEAHPEARDNPRLAPLLKVREEDNPVVVIVE